MAYKQLIAAIVILVIVVLFGSLLTTQLNDSDLSEIDVKQIAENYVETSIEGAVPISSQLTGREGSQWLVTITYQQGEGANCKVGKCHWKGPASQFCRIESNQTLRPCS